MSLDFFSFASCLLDSSFRGGRGGGAGFEGVENRGLLSKVLDFWVSQPDQADVDCATAAKGDAPVEAIPNPKVYVNKLNDRRTFFAGG